VPALFRYQQEPYICVLRNCTKSILNECCPNYLALLKKAPSGAFFNNAKLQIIGVSR
jgi:hypothetical protein